MHTFNTYWASLGVESSRRENFLGGVEMVYSWSQAANSTLSIPSVLGLNSLVFPESPGFRTTEVKPLSEAHDPPLAILVERLVTNALDWFGTEGFAEMNPVEQAALVYLRFADLQAFATGNETMAALLASQPLLRAGLPPLIIETSDPRHQAALDSALRMLTQHLVNFIAETLTSYPAMEF